MRLRERGESDMRLPSARPVPLRWSRHTSSSSSARAPSIVRYMQMVVTGLVAPRSRASALLRARVIRARAADLTSALMGSRRVRMMRANGAFAMTNASSP